MFVCWLGAEIGNSFINASETVEGSLGFEITPLHSAESRWQGHEWPDIRKSDVSMMFSEGSPLNLILIGLVPESSQTLPRQRSASQQCLIVEVSECKL
jgi:hypothetical protein